MIGCICSHHPSAKSLTVNSLLALNLELLYSILFLSYQDNYLEEALKMRNLLEEFNEDHGVRPPTILGVREHIFTGR